VDDSGKPSFRLELLTEVNGIEHGSAHDALSDVEATIALAQLIRTRQPRLFEYALRLRSKAFALEQLDLDAMKPVLHVSGMFGAERHNIALVAPLARHPKNRNEIICYDLAEDPTPIEELDAQALAAQLFAPASELAEGVTRPGLKTVHLNRSPMLVTPKLLDPPTAERLGIDVELCRRHRSRLQHIPDLVARLQAVYGERSLPDIQDPDRMLYSGGFFGDEDRRTMDRLRSVDPAQLASETFIFEDPRGPEMLFRYRARNFPDSLSAEERARWEEHRYAWLTDPAAGASITLEDFHASIERLSSDAGAEQQALLDALLEYGDSLLVA
jgi:exodeoxyribonuclease-1